MEVMYDRASVSNNVIATKGCANSAASSSCAVSGSAVTTRLRIQRDF